MKLDNSKILIVDDDFEVIQIILNYLKKQDFDIFYAKNGREALEKIQKTKFDCVLMDVQMPELNGFETCIKINEIISSPPVIFITGFNEPHTIKSAFESGGHDYITKPINKIELLTRLNNVLELKKYRESLIKLVEERTKELEQKTEQLNKKNIALQEILNHLHKEKKEIAQTVVNEFITLIEPFLDKLFIKMDESEKEYVDLIKKNIKKIINKNAGGFIQLKNKLTDREFEICNFILKGLGSKEISNVMHIGLETVKSHRKNIRKKLELDSNTLNLNDYLNSLEE